ncbi:MAG: helix-turn-helix domain-containing protein [Lentisphaerae bacterium]|nr:helix-turn-helix domain-containing protein [Lentisphaerota bacterium]
MNRKRECIYEKIGERTVQVLSMPWLGRSESDDILIFNHQYSRRNDKWHRHGDFYELVLVCGGTACNEIGDKRQWLRAGAMQIFYPGTVHRYTSIRDFYHYNLLFSPALLQGKEWNFAAFPKAKELLFNPAGFSPVCHLDDYDMEKTVNRFEILKQEFFRQDPGWRDVLFFEFGAALTFLLRHVKMQEKFVSSGISRIENCIRFMEENMLQTLSLADLAHYTNMSESNFRHQFLAVTGFPPIEYLIRLRLKRAVTLLGTHYSLAEIAQRSGFADVNYFSRQFRRHLHVSPRELARQLAGGKMDVNVVFGSLLTAGTAE